MAYFSIIIPVYNRLDEVRDLLDSLSKQTDKDFEVVLVEDGSTLRCDAAVKEFEDRVDVKYFYKENEGRSIARNYGMERASGEYFLFFDSDCVIPEHYIATLRKALEERPTDCFGGPDAAHSSFSDTQKAINYSMTSFLTTGGIRGGKVQLEKFVPRTFNMGFSRRVWEKVGGFREMFSEDIDMSTRIRQAGFAISLIREAYVYHKRRVNSDVKTVTGELAGAGDAGRAGADDGDLLAVLGGHLGRGGELGAVTQEALELADGHRLGLLATDAPALALVLLRADAAADGGKHGVLADGIESAAEVLRADLLDKVGDVDVDGAALDTERLLAVEAALGLGQRHLLGEALVDGAEVAGALGSRLLVIGGAGRLHIGNETTVN